MTLDEALEAIDASWPAGTEGQDSMDATDAGEMVESSNGLVADADTPLASAFQGELDGTTVSIFGPFTDADEVKFNEALVPFEEATGIDVQYTGSKEFEATIAVRIDAGDAPDLAAFPQPGLLANFVADGVVKDASEFFSDEYMQAHYAQSWLDMSMMDGPDGEIMAGIWQRFNGKSIVFYPKKQFDAAGYTVPTTWDEMVTLMDQIVEDGDTPWCVGIESGAATGWVATDWMENIMLRTTSLENYDKWVSGELPFASPEVKNAAEVMSSVWLNDDYVNGGVDSIITTFIGDAPVPMFQDPPGCWFHAQAAWIVDFFGEDAKSLKPGEDYDFFYMPSIDPAYGKPFLIAGDIYAAFDDRPEVQAVMQYFTTGQSMKSWLATGGTLAPQKDVQLDWYGNPIDRKIAELVNEATSLRFDASDLMPGQVGAGSFWSSMTDYVSGNVTLDEALEAIDASWPR